MVKTYTGQVKRKYSPKDYGDVRKFFVLIESEELGEVKCMFYEEHFHKFEETDTIAFEGTKRGEWISITSGREVSIAEEGDRTGLERATVITQNITKFKANSKGNHFSFAWDIGHVEGPENFTRMYLSMDVVFAFTGEKMPSEKELEEYSYFDNYDHWGNPVHWYDGLELPGYSKLEALGSISDGVFWVERIISNDPINAEIKVNIDVKDIEFGYDEIEASFEYDGKKFIVKTDDLPFPSIPAMNEFKDSLDGFIIVDGTFKMTGRIRLDEEKEEWVKEEWFQSEQIGIAVEEKFLESLKEAKYLADKDEEWSMFVYDVKRRLSNWMLDFGELEREMEDRGFEPDREKLLKAIWKNVYDKEYFEYIRDKIEEKKDLSVFITPNNIFGFTWTGEDGLSRIIAETPIIGSATYFFVTEEDPKDILVKYSITPKSLIIKNQEGIAVELGYVGRAIHAGTDGLWKFRINQFISASEIED